MSGAHRGRRVVRGLIIGLATFCAGVVALWLADELGGVETLTAFVLASLIGLAFAGVFAPPQ